jgi:hypothetical protein
MVRYGDRKTPTDCRLAEGMDPGFSKPFPPEFLV